MSRILMNIIRGIGIVFEEIPILQGLVRAVVFFALLGLILHYVRC